MSGDEVARLLAPLRRAIQQAELPQEKKREAEGQAEAMAAELSRSQPDGGRWAGDGSEDAAGREGTSGAGVGVSREPGGASAGQVSATSGCFYRPAPEKTRQECI